MVKTLYSILHRSLDLTLNRLPLFNPQFDYLLYRANRPYSEVKYNRIRGSKQKKRIFYRFALLSLQFFYQLNFLVVLFFFT